MAQIIARALRNAAIQATVKRLKNMTNSTTAHLPYVHKKTNMIKMRANKVADHLAGMNAYIKYRQLLAGTVPRQW